MKCSKCPSETVDNYKLCITCRQYFKTKLQISRAKDSESKAKDKSSRTLRLLKRLSEGLCACCISNKLDNSVYCLYHYVYNAGRAYGVKDKSQVLALQDKLKSQDFKCFYSGVTIVPGINASIEHVVPRSHGCDSADISNIVWIDLRVNKMKGSMPLNQFIEICSQIINTYNTKRVEKGNDVK